MSVQIHWEALNNDFVASFLTNTINYVIMQNKSLLLGGFAYVDTLQLGATPPSFEFLSIETMTDSHVVGEIAFGYNSQLLVKAQVYAPINPLQSTSKFAKRSRLHMNVAQSAAPGYINVWACVRDLHVEGTARIEFKAFTEEQKLAFAAQEQKQPDGPIMSTKKGIVTITLNSFPLKQVRVSLSLDGSVLSAMMSTMINDNLNKAKDQLAKQSYTFSLPI